MTGNRLWGCYSTLPDYAVTTACARFFPDDDIGVITATYLRGGTTVTGRSAIITATHPMSTRRFTLTGTATSGIEGITFAPFVTLVHQPTDISTSNAAARLSSVPLFGGHGVVAALSVWMVGMILGAAVVLPW